MRKLASGPNLVGVFARRAAPPPIVGKRVAAGNRESKAPLVPYNYCGSTDLLV